MKKDKNIPKEKTNKLRFDSEIIHRLDLSDLDRVVGGKGIVPTISISIDPD